MASLLLSTLTIALTSLLTSCDVDVPVKNHWNGGFQGNACLDITEELTHWTMHLRFDQPISSLEVWSADIDSTNADKTEYILTNKAWNGVEHAGDTLCVDFLGHGNGDITPTITASIEQVSGGGSFTMGPTQSPGNTASPGQGTATPGFQGPVYTGEGYPGTLEVKQDWGNRFEGEIDFPVQEDIEGWMANITFSKPVTKMDIFIGDTYAHSADGYNWIVVNKRDRPFYKPGDTINMRFFGNFDGEKGAPSATAILYNLGKDKNFTIIPAPDTIGSKYNYDDVLMKSILFYEAQRSGKLPANNRIAWRDDSALNDKGANGEDLTGGWYDAGDHVKFNFPMAYTAVVLSWGLLEYRDAYEAAGQLPWIEECIKWPLDYLLKCHTAEDELYIQVGDGGADHSYWGRPEDMPMSRPAYKIDSTHPGSDVAMETAAAFAAGAMVFNDTDSAYSSNLLAHAMTLWQFALDHKGKYSDSVRAANAYYPSYNYTDEMCWGPMWLYRATGDDKYLTEAKKWFDPAPDWGMSWDDKIVACQLMLYEATGEDKYKQAVIGTFDDWFPGGSIDYTPKGLAWRLQWAPLRYASNMAMMALFAAKDGINADKYRHWAMCQIHYVLGDTGFSYVVGFGNDYPLREHHRGAQLTYNLECLWQVLSPAPSPCGPQIMSSNAPNVHTLYGALVGGPDQSDGYKDERSNYVMNEVACDYNAGFQTAVAGLRDLWITNEHPEQTGDDTCPYAGS